MSAKPMGRIARHLVQVDGAQLEIFRRNVGAKTVVCSSHQYAAQLGTGAWAEAFERDDVGFVWVNPRGTGGSSPEGDPAALTMTSLVRDLEQVRRTLGLTRWIFAGASTGGMLGLLYALQFPHALSAMILCGTAPSYLYAQEPASLYNPAHPGFPRFLEVMMAARGPGAGPEAIARWGRVVVELSLHKKECLEDVLRERDLGQAISMERITSFLTEIMPPDPFDVRERLSEIRIPSLLLCGRHDAQCPLPQSELLHRGIAGSRLEVFDDSGHFPYIEERERFRGVVQQFLRG